MANSIPKPIRDEIQTVTKQYTDNTKKALIDDAPLTLDTLKKIAASVGNNPNFVSDITKLIKDIPTGEFVEIIHSEEELEALYAANKKFTTISQIPNTTGNTNIISRPNDSDLDDMIAIAIDPSHHLISMRHLKLDPNGNEIIGSRPNEKYTVITDTLNFEHVNSHIKDMALHVSTDDRTKWDAKEAGGAAKKALTDAKAFTTTSITAIPKPDIVKADLDAHKNDKVTHVTAVERTTWNAKANTADLNKYIDKNKVSFRIDPTTGNLIMTIND